MRIQSLLSILDTILETAIVVRAQFLTARAYRDTAGMVQALETSMLVDQDLIAILEDGTFEPISLSSKEFPAPPGTPEEILELMKKLKRVYTASISRLLRTQSDEILELEERRAVVADHKMQAVGNYFRMLKRLLKKQWHAWKPAYDETFRSMLKLKAPKKK